MIPRSCHIRNAGEIRNARQVQPDGLMNMLAQARYLGVTSALEWVGEFTTDFAREASGRKAREKAFIETSCLNGMPHLAIGTAGFPWTTVMAGTDCDTTLPAATTAPLPTMTFGKIIAPGPMNASRSILTPRNSLKWAMIVARILIATSCSIVINSGKAVSRTTS